MYIGARVHMFVSLHITMLTRKETGLNRNLPIFYNEQSERERERNYARSQIQMSPWCSMLCLVFACVLCAGSAMCYA